MSASSTDPVVRHDDAASRYELLVDGEVVAYADHRAVGEGVEVFPHTVTDPAHRGNGYAGILVQAAMDDVRARGARVVPQCWYVAQWLDQHPDYADLRAG